MVSGFVRKPRWEPVPHNLNAFPQEETAPPEPALKKSFEELALEKVKGPTDRAPAPRRMKVDLTACIYYALTMHVLTELTEKIRQGCDFGQFGCGIFLDLQKAFGTVNPNILLKKLEHYGIRRVSNIWFKSYITNRKQHIYH